MKETANKREEEEGYTEVFAWGSDRYGQLGLGNKQTGRCYCIPRFCSFNVTIRSVSCGDEHSAFITGKGQIFTFGSNSEGRLGLGDKSVAQSSTPCLVESLCRQRATQVACGWGHTAAVLDNGDIYTWGVGENGILGVGSGETQWAPVRLSFAGKLGVHITKASCGTRHTAMVDDKGRLFVCGSNDAGQLGTGSREKEMLPFLVSSVPEPVEGVACGTFHTLILTSTGRVYATGGNTFGQLGTGNKRGSRVPLKLKELEDKVVVKVAAGQHSAALTETGEALIWGTGIFGEYLQPTSLNRLGKFISPIKDVSIGACFGTAVDRDGTVYSWGANSSGELGVGDYEPRTVPAPISSLQGKVVTLVSCGGSSAIALGQTIVAPVSSFVGKYSSPTRAPPATEPRRPAADRRRAEDDAARARSPADRHADELLEVVRSEQKKRQDLELQLDELKRTQAALRGRERELADEKPQDSYKDHLQMVEKQIEKEREKCMGMIQDLDAEQRRVDELESAKGSLERKLESLEGQMQVMESEGVRLKGERLAQRTGENIRLSEVLKEYDEKIEREKAEKLRLTQEKDAEIAGLKNMATRLSSAAEEVDGEKQKVEQHYREEADKFAELLEDYGRRIQEEEAAQQKLRSMHGDCDARADELKSALDKQLQARGNAKEQMDEICAAIDRAKTELAGRQKELAVSRQKCDEIRALLNSKQDELAQMQKVQEDHEAAGQAEEARLKQLINDKAYDNEDLQNKVNTTQVEIDTLQKDVQAWKQVAENVRTENDGLHGVIETLEEKNRKLEENFAKLKEQDAREAEHRTVRAIKNSASPMKIQRILKSGGYKTPGEPRIASPSAFNPMASATSGEEMSFAGGERRAPAQTKTHEPVPDNTTEKLVKALGTESPIRRKVATGYLSPGKSRQEGAEEAKEEYGYAENRTGTAVTAVMFMHHDFGRASLEAVCRT